MATATQEREPIVAPEEERATLAEIHQQLLRYQLAHAAKLVGPAGEETKLPASLFRVLQQAVRVLMQGEVVTIVPIHKELTTQEAADLLNVSRQYLIRLLERGDIPYTKTGTHRRIKFGDLMAYRERRDAARRRALDRLTQMSQEMGLPM